MTIPNLTHEQRLALAELLNNKDIDVLREMLATVYDAAIKVQFEAGSLPWAITTWHRHCAQKRGAGFAAAQLPASPLTRNTYFTIKRWSVVPAAGVP